MRKSYLVAAMIWMAALSCGSCMRSRPISAGLPAPQAQPMGHALLTEQGHAVIRLTSEATAEDSETLARLEKEQPEVAELAEHVANNPLDVGALHSLAAAYTEAGLLTNAFDLYQQVIILAPDDPQANIGLALIWDSWKNYDLALRYASHAATHNPSSSKALEALGSIYLHRKDIDRALECYLAAEALSPMEARIFANTGYIYILREDWQHARHNLERAVSLDGTLPEARNNLGIVLARAGDREGALRQFLAVNDLAAAHNNLGVAYLGLARWDLARQEFLLALSAKPEYEKAAANLAEVERRGTKRAKPNLPGIQSKTNVETPELPDEGKIGVMRAQITGGQK
jgi:Flp pilus assembly protein TadD